MVTSVSPKLNSGFNVIEKPNGSYKLGIGVGVAVGGTGVAVGGTGVAVGGTGVVVGGTDVAAGGTDVAVGGTDVAVEGTAAADCVIVLATGGTVSVVEPPPHARMNSNINNPVKVIVSFVGEPIIMCHH